MTVVCFSRFSPSVSEDSCLQTYFMSIAHFIVNGQFANGFYWTIRPYTHGKVAEANSIVGFQ